MRVCMAIMTICAGNRRGVLSRSKGSRAQRPTLTDSGKFHVFEQEGGGAYTRVFVAASPLYHDGLLYIVDVMGTLRVVDAKTQTLVYRKNLDLGLEIGSRVHQMGLAHASPILAGKHICVVGLQGVSVVFEPGSQYKEVGRSRIEHLTNIGHWRERPETFSANPICEGNRLYLRGEEGVYCIGDK